MSTETERLAMFRDCLLAVAPVFARDAIRKFGTIAGDVYDPTDKSEAVAAQRRQVAAETAELAAQVALHLASKYAEFYEAVSPEAQDAAAAEKKARERFQASANPVKEIQ